MKFDGFFALLTDFYFNKLPSVIEVDGFRHEFEEVLIKDTEKLKFLEQMGLNFIRVDDIDIKFNLSNLVMAFETFILN